MGLLPGVGKIKQQMADANLDDGILKRQEAIIQSMTLKERRNPDLLNASRKKRVAKGSGTDVSEINRLLKMHRQMADMVKSMGKLAKGKGGGLAGMLGGLGGGGGIPPGAPGSALPPGFKMPPGGLGGLGGGLPGLGGAQPPKGLPGLGGLPIKGKKP